jgi:Ribbon-helix-helix protein, copG family
MPLSVRLDRETEARIRRMARLAGRSKSWIVREAIAAYSVGSAERRKPYDILAPFIGAGGTGLSDLSEATGERFTEIVAKKARVRHSR